MFPKASHKPLEFSVREAVFKRKDGAVRNVKSFVERRKMLG
jgi:hypothetical protein